MNWTPNDVAENRRWFEMKLRAEKGKSGVAAWSQGKAAGDFLLLDVRGRDSFAKELDPTKQKAIAEQAQARAMQVGTHIHLGQWYQPVAVRKNVDGMIEAPVSVFWNVQKKGS